MLYTSKFLPLLALGITWLIYYQGQHSNAEKISNSLCFAKENSTSLLPFVPKRMTPSGLNGIANPLKCARHSLLAFPESKGFLYNPVSGLCSPLLWLEGPSSPGAQSVQSHEGDLYLSCEVCGDQFEIMEVGDIGELVCLKHFNTIKVTQSVAAAHCSAMEAYLVSVKTLAKLELIQRVMTDNTWVGLEYSGSKRVFIWSKDGEILTTQQISEVFYPGQPSGVYSGQHCVEMGFSWRALNDVQCSFKLIYICERDVPRLND